MPVSDLTSGCNSATIQLSNTDLCNLQMACMDRITNLRALIQSAEARVDQAHTGRLKIQLERMEDLLARLVQL